LQGLLDDVPVSIWTADAAALADADPVLQWQGATDGARIDPESGRVTIGLTLAAAAALHAPRLLYGPAMGMNTMIPAGAVIKVGDKTYTVERK